LTDASFGIGAQVGRLIAPVARLERTVDLLASTGQPLPKLTIGTLAKLARVEALMALLIREQGSVPAPRGIVCTVSVEEIARRPKAAAATRVPHKVTSQGTV
jgi:hypothetical protein